MSVPELRRLLYRVVWAGVWPATFILHWSRWRRHHQARAQACHYKRRLARLSQQLQL